MWGSGKGWVKKRSGKVVMCGVLKFSTCKRKMQQVGSEAGCVKVREFEGSLRAQSFIMEELGSVLVDVGALLESFPHRPCLLSPLAACQVDQADLAHLLPRHLCVANEFT